MELRDFLERLKGLKDHHWTIEPEDSIVLHDGPLKLSPLTAVLFKLTYHFAAVDEYQSSVHLLSMDEQLARDLIAAAHQEQTEPALQELRRQMLDALSLDYSKRTSEANWVTDQDGLTRPEFFQ